MSNFLGRLKLIARLHTVGRVRFMGYGDLWGLESISTIDSNPL